MFNHFFSKNFLIFSFIATSIFSCNVGNDHPTSTNPGKASVTTGRPFNKKGGMHVKPAKGKLNLPKNMVYVEGGYMMMGSLGEDASSEGNHCTKPVTITSFYIDEAPITNLDYIEYLNDLKKNNSKAYEAALPNQKVWVGKFSFNDPFVENYLFAPGFMFYPVVGVTWEQATQYCKWRTEVVYNKTKKSTTTKMQLQENKTDQQQKNEESQEEEDLNVETTGLSIHTDTEKQTSNEQDNIEKENHDLTIEWSLPAFRLPTEAEWEYAARAIVGTAKHKNNNTLTGHQRIYPWGTNICPRDKNGKLLVNFKKGSGMYKGVTGECSHAAPTSQVCSYPPNELGIYDMVGNVCCWVQDTYRPLSIQDIGDLNPIRRDGFLDDCSNYQINDNNNMDDERVYKGCSWNDSAYFLQIGTRRHLNKNQASPTIGFRCVVSSLGQ